MLSAITPAGTLPPPVPSETKPTFSSQPSAPPVPSGSKPRSMQLGIQKTSVPGALPGGLAEEARWGGDLIDVNADADDWSTCLNLSSFTITNLSFTHPQMNSRVHQQSQVALTLLGWVGTARRMMRTRGQRLKIPHRHPFLSLSRSSHRHPYRQLLRHQL
jgi:hypothetical protein